MFLDRIFVRTSQVKCPKKIGKSIFRWALNATTFKIRVEILSKTNHQKASKITLVFVIQSMFFYISLKSSPLNCLIKPPSKDKQLIIVETGESIYKLEYNQDFAKGGSLNSKSKHYVPTLTHFNRHSEQTGTTKWTANRDLRRSPQPPRAMGGLRAKTLVSGQFLCFFKKN